MSLAELLNEIFASSSLLHAVLSSPRSKNSDLGSKTTIRPLIIKQQPFYQLTTQKGEKVFHQNLTPQQCQEFILSGLENHFKQALLCTVKADYQVLTSDKGQIKILKKPPTHKLQQVSHNRPKKYILEEGIAVPYLIELGVMDKNRKVIAKKWDKFKQLNHFLEIVSTVIDEFKDDEVIRIVDFGCGKAYLTFALYDYFVRVLKKKVEIHGLDLKEDVIAFCQSLSKKLHFQHLQFSLGDIQHYKASENIDMVISLHACDTATDAALIQAVNWNAKVILCVPCCQHELFNQIKNEELRPILHHGILRERFAALATDAARAQLLEIVGYHTDVMEFIDLEHTPKNLLIRAIKRKQLDAKTRAKKLESYQAFKNALNIAPSIENLNH